MGELNILPVEHIHQVQRTAALAKEIWTEHYTPIIGAEQVAYMLEHFQSEEAIASQIKEGYFYYLMEVDGTAAGYAAIKPEGDTMFLSKIYVHQKFRQQKIAARTLSYLEEIAREHGCRSIYLTVNKNNGGSIAAYERLGFRKVRTQKADIGGGFFMDDDIMEKAILL